MADRAHRSSARDLPNLLTIAAAAAGGAEAFETILETASFKLERIVSHGQTTPAGEWYDQEREEWILLARGSAELRFEDEAEPRRLRPGDHLVIAAHRRHRVEWTHPSEPTIWLALHYSR